MSEALDCDQRPHAQSRGVESEPSAPRIQPSATSWERIYQRWVIVGDAATTAVAVAGTGATLTGALGWHIAELLIAGVATFGAVMVSLLLAHAWQLKFLGQGADEFAKLGRGLCGALVLLSLATLLLGGVTGARLWVCAVGSVIAAALLVQRYIIRKVLHRARVAGRCLLPVLAAGEVPSVREIIDRTREQPHLGWRVEAVCTTSATGAVDGVPVVGSLEEVADHVRRGGYRLVAVTPGRYWSPETLQRLAWELEGSGADMVVASGLMEIAGPRLHVSGVLGMPLLRVSEPALRGFPRAVKGFVDRVVAALLLVLLAPLMLITASLVGCSSRGGVFYRQRRVGKNGAEFTMIKYRTMVVDADARRGQVEARNEGSGPLFKLRKDPRVTKMGGVLRRLSIDELPQLLNVLCGQMSLVGPRPPLPDETARYAPHVRRRLLVKPGITGLWQVNGRSDLPWDEAVRLDLRYVEDWSLALDALIVWKTLRAVLGGRGAY